jgi:hypothetical protein
MALLISLQLLLPLVLLGCLACWPARSVLGLAAQIAATVSVLAALQIAGLWLIPPWWATLAYWLLLLIALVSASRRRPASVRSKGFVAWALPAVFALVAVYAGWIAASGWQGRDIPGGPIVDLQFPLRDGPYLVANGGTNTTISSHARTLARATPRQRLYWGQSYGVDIVAIDRFGLVSNGISPSEPRRYRIFGHKVHAPCDGLVVQAADHLPDMPVPVMDSVNMAGNHVLLRCAGADVLMAHFRKGSLRVRPGDRVRSGTLVAEVGNSGNSSMPHLHIHAQEPGTRAAPFSGRPLPMRFDGRYLVRGDRL